MVSRKTTKEERMKIVQYCIEHNSNYDRTAKQFDVTFEEVFNWVKNFCVNGINGLDDNNVTVDDKLNITRLNNEKEYLGEKLEEAELQKRLLLRVQEIEAREKNETGSKKKNNRKKERHKKNKH